MMLKIRDLGTPVISIDQTESTGCDNESCNPSGQCLPSCEGASRAPGHHGVFSGSAAEQLRKQLRNQLAR